MAQFSLFPLDRVIMANRTYKNIRTCLEMRVHIRRRRRACVRVTGVASFMSSCGTYVRTPAPVFAGGWRSMGVLLAMFNHACSLTHINAHSLHKCTTLPVSVSLWMLRLKDVTDLIACIQSHVCFLIISSPSCLPLVGHTTSSHSYFNRSTRSSMAIAWL